MMIPHRLESWLARLSKLLARFLTGGRVAQGPFQGLNYGNDAAGSAYYAKLFGTYELELIPVVVLWRGIGFGQVIDIGAAEGYYAVGAAHLLRCPVIAFEMDSGGRHLLEEMARANSVSKAISVLGECTAAALDDALARNPDTRTLIICDTEGFERILLDPDSNPHLARCWILVEVHDCFFPGTRKLLEARFEKTHLLETIATRPRVPMDFPRATLGQRMLPARLKCRYMNERRPAAMDWLWMVPRTSFVGPAA